MKYSQIRTQSSPVRVPESLVGKRAGIFFLLNEIELRKARAKAAIRPDKVDPRPARPMGAGRTHHKTLVLTDEFIFA